MQECQRAQGLGVRVGRSAFLDTEARVSEATISGEKAPQATLFGVEVGTLAATGWAVALELALATRAAEAAQEAAPRPTCRVSMVRVPLRLELAEPGH